jgi:hypothetical protein
VKKTGANPANPGHAAFSNSAAHANFTATWKITVLQKIDE